MDERLTLQETEYSEPYHWLQDRNLGRLYTLRTGIVLELAGELRGMNVLDFGCGDGKFTSVLVSHAPARTAGGDVSERAVAFARTHVPQADFHVWDEIRLPFEDASFDVVFALDVIEHIPEKECAPWLEEMWRVLRPGGRFVFSVPTKNKNLDRKHFRHFLPAELRELLGSGFDSFRFQGYFARTPLLPVAVLDKLYNRRYLWHMFTPLIRRCPIEQALYFAGACIKAR